MDIRKNIHHRKSIRLKGYDYSKAGIYFITICCENRAHRFGKIAINEGIAQAQMILNELGQIAYHEWAKLPERFPNIELGEFQIMPNHMHGIIILNDAPVGARFTLARNDVISRNDKISQNDSTPQNEPSSQNNAIFQNNVIPENEPSSQNDAISQDDVVNQNNSDIPNNSFANNELSVHNELGINNESGLATARVTTTVSDIIGAYKSLVANGCLDLYKSKNKIMGKIWQRNYYEHIICNEKSFNNISNYIIKNPEKWNNDKFNI